MRWGLVLAALLIAVQPAAAQLAVPQESLFPDQLKLLSPGPVAAAPNTTLAFRLSWGKGDRQSQDISLVFEIQLNGRGTVRVQESHNDFSWIDGHAPLAADEITGVMRAAERAKFWEQPEKIAMPPDKPNAGDIEIVTMCWNRLVIRGFKAAQDHNVDMWCPDNNKTSPVFVLAREFIQIARRHFPDLARDREYWSDLP